MPVVKGLGCSSTCSCAQTSLVDLTAKIATLAANFAKAYQSLVVNASISANVLSLVNIYINIMFSVLIGISKILYTLITVLSPSLAQALLCGPTSILAITLVSMVNVMITADLAITVSFMKNCFNCNYLS